MYNAYNISLSIYLSTTAHKKWRVLLNISSVNVTMLAKNGKFSHIY